MKPSLLILLLAFSYNLLASNHVHGEKDENEVRLILNNKRTPDVHYQHYLRNRPNWQNFLANHGTWYVHFNETNAKPHKAFGKPIAIPGTDVVSKAEYFIQEMLEGFNIPTDQLVFVNATRNSHAQHVFFKQQYEGRDVLNAKLSVRFATTDEVVGFSADVYSNLSVDEPEIDASEAAGFAVQGLTHEVLSVEAQSDWKVLAMPKYASKETAFRPVFEVTVFTEDEDGIPANYLTYVDAVNGSVLMRTNLVAHCASEPPGSASAVVTDDVSLTQPFAPETNTLLPNLEVTQGGSTFHTDASGNVEGLNPGNATFTMRGLWSEVFNNGTTPSFTTSIVNGVNNVDWGANADSKESSAFYHVNIIHDYMKSKFPNFTGLDSPLETNVDVAGTCNAFYNGTSINFYTEGAGCNSYALVADVVYHEYGHGINDRYYQSQSAFFQNGAMNEGYADIWAIGITNNPILGQGNSQSLPDNYIRRYDIDPKIYPQDIVGQVHADGEIIAGAWWQLAENFGDLQQMMDLYSATFDAAITGPNGNEGEVYVDILVEALQVDDSPVNGGDNDITNGTPNDLDIINAFDAHGITLLSNAELDHTPIEASDDVEIDIEAEITLEYAWALNDAILAYRVNDATTWTTTSLNNIGGSVYAASIPAQPIGTVVAYYVALQNLNGTLANVQPIAADLVEPNVPNYILVGYEQNRIEDFDTFQDGGWQEGLPSDNATTGQWTIDIPTGSFSDDGVMVQTDEDHTPGSGNIACAFTGNAGPNDGLGVNDVDGGHTTLVTPILDLSALENPAISYWRYYTNSPPTGANPGNDWWQVLITDDEQDWVFVENTKVSDASWRRVAIRVADYVDVTDNVRLMFIASDSILPNSGLEFDGGSLVEGAMDDLQVWELKGSNPDGINETEIGNLSIYPNPSNGVFNVSLSFDEPTNLAIEVIDIRGATVYSRKEGRANVGKMNLDVDLSAISDGIYQLRMLTEKGQVTRRIELIR
jgi:Zn-dependent metalloprotease